VTSTPSSSFNPITCYPAVRVVRACNERHSHVHTPYIATYHHAQTRPDATARAAVPIIKEFVSPCSRGSTTRRAHRPRASYTPTAHHHHRWQVLPPLRTTRSFIRHDRSHSTSQGRAPRVCCASRLHQHRRMSGVSRRTRCSREGRCSERKGWFGEPHHHWQWPSPSAVLCVYVANQCTAESSRGCGGNALASVLLDCRGRCKKRWEWQPSSLLTRVGV
jgi:hypothetical protein